MTGKKMGCVCVHISISVYISIHQNKVLIRQKKIIASEEKYAEDKNRLFINEKEQMAIIK